MSPMNYWWVNHKQTYKDEVGRGYLWSPTANKDGTRNQTYLNMAEFGRTTLSFPMRPAKSVRLEPSRDPIYPARVRLNSAKLVSNGLTMAGWYLSAGRSSPNWS